jgi:hypothetical protein
MKIESLLLAEDFGGGDGISEKSKLNFLFCLRKPIIAEVPNDYKEISDFIMKQ